MLSLNILISVITDSDACQGLIICQGLIKCFC